MSLEEEALEMGANALKVLAPVVERALTGERVNVGRELLFKFGELLADELEARKFAAILVNSTNPPPPDTKPGV